MRKVILLLINILSAIVTVIALCFIQIRFSNNSFVNILNSPIYEKTDEFSHLVNEKIHDVFEYINLKFCFEYNNELNYDRVIAESLDNYGNFRKWTLKECIDNATDHGLYIDPSYKVCAINSSEVLPFNKNDTFNFLIKTYPSTSKVGISTEQDFYTEVLNALAEYYKNVDYFNSEGNNFYYTLSFSDEFNDDVIYKNTEKAPNNFLESQAFAYVSSKDGIVSSNISALDPNIMKNMRHTNPYPGKDFTFYCMVDTLYPKNDIFKTSFTDYAITKSMCATLVITSIIASLIFIISLFLLLYFIFSSKRMVDDTQDFIHFIPTEFYLILYIIISSLFIFFINNFDYTNIMPSDRLLLFKMYLYILALYITSMSFFTILSIKHINGTLGLTLFIFYKKTDDTISFNLNPIATFFTVFIPIILFFGISFYLLYLYTIIKYKIIFIMGLILLFSTICFAIYLLLLHDAFNKSIDIQTKSNDMRVSLITNVSHDIKTPLTSIINYTSLITQEINSPGKNFKKNVEHYSEIVTDKANRLNNLINELIFESKVSTGNISLEMKPFNIIPFINQIIVEFKDKFNVNGLKVIYEHEKDNIMINADDKQLYRVFQNLFSNICKYALDKSRVYIDATEKNKIVIITIKNIQKEKLEVNVDTLKDRFVRGKKARNTEGFGLGLSIAENLIKSMGGKLDIKSVRDEFIAIIKFVPYHG